MSDAISPLIHAVNAVGSLNNRYANTAEDSPVSLAARMSHAIANQVVENQQTRNQIFAAMNDPNVTSDSAQLIEWQKRLAIYTLDTNLCSTLVRKGVAAVETLIKT